MPAEETRATAKLPHLDIEIRHRTLPEEGAELLSINLRATPDLDRALSLLDPFRLASAWAAFNPWLAWFRLAQATTPRRLTNARTGER